MIDDSEEEPMSMDELPLVRVKVIGIGGAGNNIVDRLKMHDLNQVHLANVNTDIMVLQRSLVADKLMIGRKVTKGLSAGGDPEIGLKAALDDRLLLERLVEDTDLVFLVAGLGGGTGSAVTPIVAEMAAAKGALVIAFTALPFSSEGKRRDAVAADAVIELRKHCHAVISLPNDLLRQEIDEEATLLGAFEVADGWINLGIRALWSIVFDDGMVNVDFASLRRAFEIRGGKTLFGLGLGEGEDCVEKALKNLETCPLLHLPENQYLRKADSIIVNIVGGPEMTMESANRIMDYVADRFMSHDNLVWGAVVDSTMAGKIQVTVIGTTTLDNGDTGGRKPQRRSLPVTPAVESNDHDSVLAGFSGEENDVVTPAPWKIKGQSPRKAGGKGTEQNEFDFPGEGDVRGLFDSSEKNMNDGIDLDIPTYFRRGIRIHVN